MKTTCLAFTAAIAATAAFHVRATEPPLALDAPAAFHEDLDAAGGPPLRAVAPRDVVADERMKDARFTGERQAAAAAAAGPERLRRFIGRTQGIFPLRFEDYLREW